MPLRRFQAWLIRRCPRAYFAAKRLREHRAADDREFLEQHAQLVETGECLCTLRERYNLWSLARRMADRAGALAELGVYRGGSAQLLAAAKGSAPLHLFDTFSGLPPPDGRTDGRFRAGQLGDTSLAQVRARLADRPDIHFHAGVFPASAATLPAAVRFKFVHLDVDLHRSTRDGLAYFSRRLTPEGLVLVHDYNNRTVPGARLAVDEFLAAHPGWRAVELWDSQILLLPPP